MKKDYEEYILEGSTSLITLNTRITQEAHDKLYEIQGYLLLENPLMNRVTKQQATEWAIHEAHKLLLKAMNDPDKFSYSEPKKKPQKQSNKAEGGSILNMLKDRKERNKKKKQIAQRMQKIMAREKVDRHSRKPWSLDHDRS